MAVTEEFVQHVSEALDELGYTLETAQQSDVIDDLADADDNVILPGTENDSQGNIVSYVNLKIVAIKNYLNSSITAIQSTWNVWFGTSSLTGVQRTWGEWFSGRQQEWDALEPDIEQATRDANTAAGNANDKAGLANEKAGLADEKATFANNQGTYAKNQGDYAKELNEHPAYIGNDNYWYLYDMTAHQYVRDAYAKGDNLDYSTMTPEEKQRLIDDIKEDIVYASVETCESIIDELQ